MKFSAPIHRLSQVFFSETPQPTLSVPWWLRLIFMCLGGTFIFLAFPNHHLFFLAYVALAIELWAIEGLSAKRAFWLGWLGGSITNIGGFYWISTLLIEFGHMPPWLSMLICSALCIVQGLVYGLWAWGVRKLNTKSIWSTAVAIFVAVEMFFPMIFPWYYANSQYNFIPAIQTADIWGVLGVTMLLVLVNVLIYDVTRTLWLRRTDKTVKFHRLGIGIAVGYILLAFIYAPIRIAQIDAIDAASPRLMVGMVEGDVGIWEKEPPEKLRNNVFIHHTMSHELSQEGIDLVVWPESSYQTGNIWGSQKTTDSPLEHELDALYAPWFQPTASLIYNVIDRSFGQDFHKVPAISTSLHTAMVEAAEAYGYRTLEPFYPSLVSGYPIGCSDEKPQIMRCPYRRLIPEDLKYYLPSVEPLRASRKDDLLSMIRPQDISSPIRDFDAAVMFGTLSIGRSHDAQMDFEKLYRESSKRRKLYNTAQLVEKDGRVLGTYHKTYLLMFGEYIPFADKLPWVYEILPEAGNLTPGTEIKTMPFRGFELGPIICYEDILPRYVRKLSKLNPHVLVNVTNDAWFGKTAEPMLHLALAMMRTVEHRRWLIRSTNTGVSAFVDANGRMVQHTSIYEPEILRQSVAMMPPTRTIYSYIGDILGWLAAIWTLMLFFLRYQFNKHSSLSSNPPLKESESAESENRQAGCAE